MSANDENQNGELPAFLGDLKPVTDPKMIKYLDAIYEANRHLPTISGEEMVKQLDAIIGETKEMLKTGRELVMARRAVEADPTDPALREQAELLKAQSDLKRAAFDAHFAPT